MSEQNYFKAGSTNGYISYPLSGFSSSSTPLVEILLPKAMNVYLIPSGKTVASIQADPNDNISNYLLVPATENGQSDPNCQLYCLKNKSWNDKLFSVNAWSQTGATTISTYNASNNVVHWQESNAWTETLVIFDSSVQTQAYNPINSTPPYITIGGYPLITVSQYKSYFSSLTNVVLPTTFPINQTLLADSSLVGSNSTLTADNVNLIVTAYTTMLENFSRGPVIVFDAMALVSGFINYVRSLLSPQSNNSQATTYMIETLNSNISFDCSTSGSAAIYNLPTYFYTSNDLNKPSTQITFTANGGNVQSNGNFVVQYWRGNQPALSGDHYPSWQLLHGSYNPSSWNNWVCTNWFQNSQTITPPLTTMFNDFVPIINEVNPVNWGVTFWGNRGSTFSLSPGQSVPGTFVNQFMGSDLGLTNASQSFGNQIGSYDIAFPGLNSPYLFNVTNASSCIYSYVPNSSSTNYANIISQLYSTYCSDLLKILESKSPLMIQEIIDLYNEFQDLVAPYTSVFMKIPSLSYGTKPEAKLYYNLIWTAQSEYVGLQYADINFMASTLKPNIQSISMSAVDTSLTIPVTDIKLVPLYTSIKVNDDEDELSKLSSGYYSAADLMVSAYYNTQLQKVYYILNNQNQTGKPSFLQLLLAYALKFNFTKDLLTEWINGHPFNNEPQVTSQLRYAINTSMSSGFESNNNSNTNSYVYAVDPNTQDSSNGTPQSSDIGQESTDTPVGFTSEDSLNAINTFVNTTIPNWSNAYNLTPDLSDTMSAIITSFLSKTGSSSSSNDFPLDFNSISFVIPEMFRKIMVKTMAMGAFLDLVHPHLTSMNIAQKALKNLGYTLNSDSSSNDNVGVLPPVTSASQNDYNNVEAMSQLSQGHYDMESHFSSNLRPLIYPLFSDVMEDVSSDVERVRDMCQDRLHGMQYSVYQPELKAIFTKRIKLTHSLIHYFTLGVHSLENMLSSIDNVADEMNKIIGESVDNLIMKPISHVLVGIARFAASALLDMTDLVAPGSEILRIIDDAAILRPVPYPLTPFLDQSLDSNNLNKNALFYNAVVNGSNANSTITPFECIVPWYGLATRQQASNAMVTYNSQSKTFSMYVSDQSTFFSFKNGQVCASSFNPKKSPASYLVLHDVTPGLHCQRLLTTAGAVDFWYSIDHCVDQTTGNVIVNTNFTSWNSGQATDGENEVLLNGLLCFVPTPVVELDGRISLTKTMHKWCIAGLALPGLFFKGSQDATYESNLSLLKSIPGFENLTAHIAISTEAWCCAADAAAGTIGIVSSALQLYQGAGTLQTDLEGYAVAAEDFANIGKITTTYMQASSINVMNSVAGGTTSGGLTVNNILAQAWPLSPSSYSLEYYNLFQDTVVNEPNNNVAAWYGQSWGRLLGDVLMGIAKLAYFLHAQHKVFKKWSQTADQPKQQKVTALGVLKNMIKNKWNRHKTIAGVDADISKLNHSFLGSKDLSGLHTYELSNAKNIRSVLADDTNMLTDLSDLTSSLGGLRGY